MPQCSVMSLCQVVVIIGRFVLISLMDKVKLLLLVRHVPDRYFFLGVNSMAYILELNDLKET